MPKDAVLVVAYGSRGAAMADALHSSSHDFAVYVADKQKNPLNHHIAQRSGGKQAVIPKLGVEDIYKFAEGIPNLQFAVVGPEGPIIKGVTDRIEDGLKVPVLAPRQVYAIEASKAAQRQLLAGVAPEANPDFRIFEIGPGAGKYSSAEPAQRDAQAYMKGFDYQVVLKPINPAAGKGVVVYGDHFSTEKETMDLFTERLTNGGVIVEEKLDGEEWSYMAFCDGVKLGTMPATRDYKRAFDGDRGPNTGGMGSYMGEDINLPFMEAGAWDRGHEVVKKLFEKMRGEGRNEGMKGVPYYVAFMETKDGPKILEINSRLGDPESINILPVLESDFGDVCNAMVRGDLTGAELELGPEATVVTYLVPPKYGGKEPGWDGDRTVDMSRAAWEMMLDRDAKTRFYPGSMELGDDGKLYSLGSRTLAVVGIGDDIEAARQRSVRGADMVGGNLWRRSDIASDQHIRKSVTHMEMLTGKKIAEGA